MTTAELLQELDRLKATMISVATGGARIQNVQTEFAQTFDSVAAEFADRGITSALPFRDLWQWYGHWNGTEELKTYQSRRAYVATLFEPLVTEINTMARRPPSAPPTPQRPNLNRQQLGQAIDRIQKRIADLESLKPSTLEKWSPR